MFSDLLGYASPEEWSKVPDFMEFVEEKSQQALASAYQEAMEKMAGSTIMVSWKKKGGGSADTSVIIVPVAFDGHLFAVHYITAQ
jgi:hypothetical protein